MDFLFRSVNFDCSEKIFLLAFYISYSVSRFFFLLHNWWTIDWYSETMISCSAYRGYFSWVVRKIIKNERKKERKGFQRQKWACYRVKWDTSNLNAIYLLILQKNQPLHEVTPKIRKFQKFFSSPGYCSRLLPADVPAILLYKVVACLGVDVKAVLCTSFELACVLVLGVSFFNGVGL